MFSMLKRAQSVAINTLIPFHKGQLDSVRKGSMKTSSRHQHTTTKTTQSHSSKCHPKEPVNSVELYNVDKFYDQCHALRNINLTIKQGEFISFLGPSGCGKTTLLRTIAGLESCNSGTILLADKDVTNKAARHRDFGIVFQSYALFPNLTVSENIGYSLKSHGLSKQETVARVDELISLVGLTHLQDRYPSQLSGGQQQRVALARALAPNPKLLLLDEPLSALDAKVRHSLRTELRQLQQKTGITTIMVTHDQEEALAVSDRIAVLNAGKIEQIGTPDEIYSTPTTEFVAEFVGTINKIKLPYEDTSCIVRPEWIELFNTPNNERHAALIESVEYHGATTRVTLSVNDLSICEAPLIIDLPTPYFKKMHFQIGQPAWFELSHLDSIQPVHIGSSPSIHTAGTSSI